MILPGPVDDEVCERLEDVVAGLAANGATVDVSRPQVSLSKNMRLFERLLVAAGGLRGQEAPISHGAWLELDEQRALVRSQWEDYFSDRDVLLCPVSPIPAFPHDAGGTPSTRRILVNGAYRPYGDLMGWPGLASLAYLPAVVVPIGRTKSGLPVGMQVVSAFLEDGTAIDVARELVTVAGGFVRPPLTA